MPTPAHIRDFPEITLTTLLGYVASSYETWVEADVDTTGTGTWVSYKLKATDARLLRLTSLNADVASAATVDLSTTAGAVANITGAVTITALTLAAGEQQWVRFTGALTLTNGSSLMLPGAANITTAAGDYALFVGYASSVVRCVLYSKVSGKATVLPASTDLSVSATSKIIGRKTAGAGASEELSLSDVLDLVGSAAQGDLLYRGASGWVRLGAGTSGQVLKTFGAAANPAWTTPLYTEGIALSDLTTALTVSTSVAKGQITLTEAITLTSAQFDVSTAPTGATLQFDVNKNGTSIYTTKPTIDVSEFSTTTAATAQVLTGAITGVAGDIFTFFVTQIGSTIAGAGLQARLIGTALL